MRRKPGIAALLTDFGLKDHYAGVVKGVILSVCPDARIVDLSHDVESQDVAAAYFLLENSYRFFPGGTLFVVVVDPGVGTERAVVGVETADFTFLAPDNGVLGFLDREERIRRIVRVTNGKYFLQPVSNTFHGRDVFAPVAGHLLRGVDLGKMGERTDSLTRLTVPAAREEPGAILGSVVSIDKFGNLITNIPSEKLPPGRGVRVEVGQGVIRGISRTYSGRKPDELLACVGSGGAVEIAVNRGSAARRLGVRVGQPVRVTLRPR
ncbi:MAG: SAM-dependent chlorinase/fluorinase [Planctomycetes bacterium]|nr:SAM-dependent chlorinase/fluorinase [Planctomycetota bacterium]